MRETPEQYEVLKVLLQAKADPNQGAQYELPFQLVIQESGKAGLEPVKLMLDAGADPNAKSSFGDPVWWSAMGKDESNALIDGANVRNWPAVLLLLQRGADWRKGKTQSGMPFKYLVEGESESQKADSAYQAVRRFVQQSY
jgi:ankyrin repeat protein